MQGERAVGAVTAHREKHRRVVVRRRARNDTAARHGANRLLERIVRNCPQPADPWVEHLEQTRDLLGIAAFLEDEPYALGAGAAVEDYSGRDRRAVGWRKRRGRVERKGEKIAVARIALAEACVQRG